MTAGVEHFNAGRFWEAHEDWERIWLAAETDVREYVQGLIQIAAAYHHVKRRNFKGAGRLFDAGMRRLTPFPNPFCGIDRAAVEERVRSHRDVIAGTPGPSFDFPALTIVDRVEPPSGQW